MPDLEQECRVIVNTVRKFRKMLCGILNFAIYIVQQSKKNGPMHANVCKESVGCKDKPCPLFTQYPLTPGLKGMGQSLPSPIKCCAFYCSKCEVP